MTTTALDPSLKNRLTRYLHTGCEVPKYYPGCWMSHKYFEADKLKAIEEALQRGVNHNEIIDIIVKAYKDGWYTRFETIAFALIKCLMVGTPAVKEAVYKAASEVCVTTEEMLLFNKFTRLMHTGNGHGWCKHVREWYLSKDAMVLALEMSRVRSRHGRSHKTLLRKSHVKIPENDHERDAVFKYAIFGLKRAKQLLSKHEETKPIFEYLQKVEDLRVCECAITAASSIEQNKFTLDHVPGHFLTSQDVWNAVLPQMPLKEILYNIQRIHNMGFLTDDSMTTSILLSLLTNSDVIKSSKVTPIEVYITLCNYKKKSRPMKYEKAKVAHEKQMRRRVRQIYDPKTDQWEWNVTRRHPKEVKNWGIDRPPNPEVLVALNKLIDQTWLLTPPTKARYLITLDMRHHMFKGRHFCKNLQVARKGKKTTAKSTPSGSGEPEVEKKESKKHLHAECFYNKHVTPGHAAIILALQILKREHNAKVAVFTDEGIQMVTIERNFSNIEEAEFVLRKANLGRVQLDAPIRWATESKQKFDVFINMIDRPSRYMELDVEDRGGRGPGGRFGPPPPEDIVDHCPVRALQKYRTKGVRDAKLIVLSLATHNSATTDGSHEGVLDIVGVDEHVPKLMDAFVLGQFK
ncbi:60 kDa SS-A/Ro ribonucleoprotein-like [Aricia agestis]|uniref:60 kDa SS-A/Ro ribonucleoprotein-like n=1 Tax=Aricia agestis TaxID=91739 RepID=UPI001C20C268|nr:60 kDa SS-A/Ro ribonucleoprotein-like [Aricia agestis]XP_041974522.1 60 kDa SS-A/Ro ribonucleoprotein-like [Aricia agestis]XP_041974523.1 60 kDa SS-A/Ro ribonucleoprotein-like [Aricia agestis]